MLLRQENQEEVAEVLIQVEAEVLILVEASIQVAPLLEQQQLIEELLCQLPIDHTVESCWFQVMFTMIHTTDTIMMDTLPTMEVVDQ